MDIGDPFTIIIVIIIMKYLHGSSIGQVFIISIILKKKNNNVEVFSKKKMKYEAITSW